MMLNRVATTKIMEAGENFEFFGHLFYLFLLMKNTKEKFKIDSPMNIQPNSNQNTT
jgi:hypothetical protein